MILFKSHTKYGTQKNTYSECMSITDRTVIIIVVGKFHRRKSRSTHFAVAALVYCMHHSAVKPYPLHLVYYCLHDFLHEHS